jgi:hypothetical protein
MRVSGIESLVDSLLPGSYAADFTTTQMQHRVKTRRGLEQW